MAVNHNDRNVSNKGVDIMELVLSQCFQILLLVCIVVIDAIMNPYE